MKHPERSFEIEVTGQYYGAHDTTGAPVVKQYLAKFKLPSLEAALSVICKSLLNPYLQKNYSDYARFRTHKIISVKTIGRSPDPKVLQMSIDDMDVADLADFCLLKHIFVDPYKHKDLEKCRAQVKEQWESRVSQQKADQKSGTAAEKKEVEDLLALNALPKLGENPEISTNEQRIGQALRRGAPKAEEPSGTVSIANPVEDVPLPPAADEDILG